MRKVRNNILAILCFISAVSCHSQNMTFQMNTAKSFVESIIEGNMSDDEIIDKYIDVNKSSAQNLDLARLQLQTLRSLIKEKLIVKNNLSYKPLDPVNDADLLISESNSSKIIIIKNGDERLIPVLFNNERIKSFATMNKGGKRIFILL